MLEKIKQISAAKTTCTSSNVSCGIDNYLQCGYNKTRELMLKGNDTPLCSGAHRGEEPLEELCV